MELKNTKGQHKIAIVGTGSLFPGALNTKDFWLNILAEKDFIKDVPETHWLKEDYYDPADKTGDKVYCQKGAFLDDVSFDPVAFGMPPNLLRTTDTVQLLSLVVARDTLADTLSFQTGKVDPKRVSVILGVAGGTELIGQMSARIHKPEWVLAMRQQGLPESKIDAILADVDQCYTKWNENTFPGLLGNVVSGRIANRFDLKGTNCVLDAACASSLAAVKMAVQELQLGTTDMVITGGADALNDIFMYMCFSKTTALSPTEDCKPFSDTGDGTVLGEAVAMMTLKRLEDAEKDGDRIYAVIASIGSSSDGKSGSIYAPDANGQSLAIRRAYADAGFSPDQIGLVEGHGTGTMAGDFAEFKGLKLGYGETAENQFCALGSVKSMIGHTKSAAGAASVLKVAMALNNAILPPTIKVDRPNPKLHIGESPFYLNTKARPWIHSPAASRKAGVSSMGFGGTNFHVAMEAYDNRNRGPKKLYRPGRELLLFSGISRAAITTALSTLLEAGQDQDLVQAAKTSQANFNPADNCRLALLGETLAAIFKWIEQLKAGFAKNAAKLDIPNCLYYAEGAPAGEVAFLFSGQGSQYLNMGTDLLMQYEEALRPWNLVAAMPPDAGKRLNNVVFPIPVFTDAARQAQADVLVGTAWAQPAIGVLALSHLHLLAKLQLKPAMVGGHSYGEVAALFAAGVITSEEDLINISRKRGALMAAASTVAGAMTAVFASEEAVFAILKKAKTQVVIANVNSPMQTVVSGAVAEVALLETELEKAGLAFQRLKVSTAFHSELVAGCAADFEAYLTTIPFGKPAVPVYSNTTAGPYPENGASHPHLLARQLAAPVQFEQQVQAMYAAGARVFVEVGPGKVLGNFVKDILQHHPHQAISIDGGKKINSKDAFWSALGQLAVCGIPLSFAAIWEDLDDNKKETGGSKPSVATVKINGSNYGKPYPPPGGFKSLPKPNPEVPAAAEPERPAFREERSPSIAAPLQQQAQQSIPREAPALLPGNRPGFNNQSRQKNTMSGVNNNWLQAFQQIQNNTLEAQKSFQQTLAESHRLFLETSQAAFQHLGSIAGNGHTYIPAVAAPVAPQQLAAAYAPLPAPAAARPQPVAPERPAAAYTAAPALVAVAPARSPEVMAVAPAVAGSTDFEATLLTIVAEKTGYPQEILDLTTDLESGLGIDSIKRVEILAALQEAFPELKNVDKAKLAAMNTLGEILDFSKTGTSQAGSPAGVPVSSGSGADLEDFQAVMLQVVADKTGYPQEILDLNTDLESGFGIDSIKRVEILSALQEKFPALKAADTARLAALNTLGEILAFSGQSTLAGAGGVSADPIKKSSPRVTYSDI